jgi:hypothetical protein
MKKPDITDILSEEQLAGFLSDNQSEMPDIPKKKPLPQKPWWIDQPELGPDLRPDSDPMGTRTLHKSTNMADDAAIEWVKNQQSRFGKLKNMLNSSAPIAKQVGKKAIGAGLGMAGLLMQEELGPESGSDDAIIEDPSQPLEVRKAAMMRMKNKYLKPQEENE